LNSCVKSRREDQLRQEREEEERLQKEALQEAERQAKIEAKLTEVMATIKNNRVTFEQPVFSQ